MAKEIKHSGNSEKNIPSEKGYKEDRFEKSERSGKLGRGELSEGYQPVRDTSDTPPGGGSGVPEKSED